MSSKKDFEACAAIIRAQVQHAKATKAGRKSAPMCDGVLFACENIACDFAALYAAENPLFNRALFFKACGLEADGTTYKNANEDKGRAHEI
jgi:hypothetical protein